jgi:hypothetical protein
MCCVNSSRYRLYPNPAYTKRCKKTLLLCSHDQASEQDGNSGASNAVNEVLWPWKGGVLVKWSRQNKGKISKQVEEEPQPSQPNAEDLHDHDLTSSLTVQSQ